MDSALLKCWELLLLFQWKMVQTPQIPSCFTDIHSAKNETIIYLNQNDSQSTRGGDFHSYSPQVSWHRRRRMKWLICSQRISFSHELHCCVASIVQQLQRLISVGSVPVGFKN